MDLTRDLPIGVSGVSCGCSTLGRLPTMASLTFVLTAVVIGLSLWWFFRQWLKWSNMPPGPWGLPFVGYAPWINQKAPYKKFAALAQKYGPIFTVTIAGVDQVIICDWEIIQEAYSKAEFSHRPDFLLFMIGMDGNNGVVASSGKLWQDNRRFVIKTLKDFGFGKTKSLDSLISNEAVSVANAFAAHDGKPFDVDYTLNIGILNIIWKMCAGEQFDHDNVEVKKVLDSLNAFQHGLLDIGPFQVRPSIVAVLPHLRRLLEKCRASVEVIIDVMLSQIDAHKKTLDDGSPRDFIDTYLLEQKKLRERGDDVSSFTDLQLRVNVQSLFIAGSDTTATTIRWTILYLASFPELQRRCHEEIDRVVGKERLPSLESDRERMPFLEATIREVQRLAHVVPMAIPHAAGEDATIRGYLIPKGTWVFANMYACHMDPRYWPDPEKFDPTRFLSEDGRLKEKIPCFLPFSLGKRQCLGESLAKMELFSFLATLLQKFEFRFPDGKSRLDFEDCDATIILRKPPSFQVIAVERS